jgi:ubiquinone/menaquinone biosynthesis C-methylase UbiE
LGRGKNINAEFSDFLEIQTRTAWGRTLAEFADWCAPQAGTLLLDLGCGPGLLPALFTHRFGCRAIGIDYDPALLASAQVPVACADVYCLPFPSSTFDFLTATNVIFLLGDPLRALRECRRVLKADGRLALLNPSEHLTVAAATALAEERGLDGKNRESLLGWAKRAEKHGSWTEEHARQMLRKAGFNMEETTLKVGPGFAQLVRAVPDTTHS